MGAVVGGRVAIIGGRGDREALESLPNIELVRSRELGGAGPIRKVEAAILAGRFELVVVLARWFGHSESKRIARACRRSETRHLVWPHGLTSLARHLSKEFRDDEPPLLVPRRELTLKGPAGTHRTGPAPRPGPHPKGPPGAGVTWSADDGVASAPTRGP